MDLSQAIDFLRNYRQKHLDLSILFMEADNGNVFPLDLLMISTLNRSMCLLKGFIELIESKNFISAAPLVRLQLDNGLRLFAGTLVNDPHEFSIQIMMGTPVKKQKDISNNLMNDTYLVNKISKIYPWINEVYKSTSGYIHLSEKHFWNAIKADEKKENTLNMKITDVDAFVTEKDYIEAVLTFRNATDVIFAHVSGWIKCKEDPKKAAELHHNESIK